MILFNTLSRAKEEVGSPAFEDKLRLYTCGLTVYSHPHIGNWSAYIYWDVLHRTLLLQGYDVKRVQNITDVGHLVSDGDDGEDKLEKAASQENVTAWDIAKKYSSIAQEEAKLLNLLPTMLVAATDRISEQMSLVDTLIQKGLTYELSDGIYFDTSQFSQYADLGKIDIEGLEAGKRVADTGKRNATDFAVWKFTPEGQTRDMQWEYPAGSGRMGFPGWHLECSAIAMTELGEQIDIHTGGIDHIPVHHSNEIAQSESATGKPFSRFWVHNNHLKINDEKLAKSEGNGVFLSDIIKQGYTLEAFKLLVLTSHYRTEGNFTWDIMMEAQERTNRWQETLAKRAYVKAQTQADPSDYVQHFDKVAESLGNDLDTPMALSAVERILDQLESDIAEGKNVSAQKIQLLKVLQDYFGIASNWEVEPEVIVGIDTDIEGVATFEELLSARAAARENKDWHISDALRDAASRQGITIEDTPAGQLYFWKQRK